MNYKLLLFMCLQLFNFFLKVFAYRFDDKVKAMFHLLLFNLTITERASVKCELNLFFFLSFFNYLTLGFLLPTVSFIYSQLRLTLSPVSPSPDEPSNGQRLHLEKPLCFQSLLLVYYSPVVICSTTYKKQTN